LMVLGRYRILRFLVREEHHPVADKLADAAEALSRECVGALIVIEREMALEAFVETGDGIDAEVAPALLRAVFRERRPLPDGAVGGGKNSLLVFPPPSALRPPPFGSADVRPGHLVAGRPEPGAAGVAVRPQPGPGDPRQRAGAGADQPGAGPGGPLHPGAGRR